MNWLKLCLTLLSLAPVIVQGVENIMQGAAHDTKRQTATNALVLASGVAAALDPNDQQTISDVSSLAQGVIDLHLKPAPATPAQ